MPAACSSASKEVCSARSSPSHSSSRRPLFMGWAVSSASAATRGTSQSAHLRKPGRYSARQLGQNMPGSLTRGSRRACGRCVFSGGLPVLQLRMSAVISTASLGEPWARVILAAASWASPTKPGSACFFSLPMADEGKTLTRGLRQRNPELLDRLIEQYQYRLFRYLLYIAGSQERAEDFFQETWIRVLERGHQYDGKSKFEAWLFAIARHMVIDWQRQKKMQSLDALTDPEEGAPKEFADENDASPLQ